MGLSKKRKIGERSEPNAKPHSRLGAYSQAKTSCEDPVDLQIILTKKRSETPPLLGMPYLLRSKNYFSLLDDSLIDAEWRDFMRKGQ